MEIKALFTASKRIHPRFGNVSFGKYIIEPVPSETIHSSGATNQYILRFNDELRLEERVSQPHQEARLLLAYLSLVMGTKLEQSAVMLNSVIPFSKSQDIGIEAYEGLIEELPQLETLLRKLQSMEQAIARQFLRACEVYRTAINLVGQNNTLSYFLFTIAVECMSNVAGDEQGTCDRFIDFIWKYLPDKRTRHRQKAIQDQAHAGLSL
jgi:hypothetical protein